MSILDSFKTAVGLAVKVRDAELKAALQDALLQAQGDALALQEQVANLRDETVELRASLDDKEESRRLEREVLYLARGVWWRRDEDSFQCYCPSCWVKSRTLIPLSRGYRVPLRLGGRCPTCNAKFEIVYGDGKPDAATS